MIEEALIIVRSYDGWFEVLTYLTNANRVFQFKDVLLTIFPDGRWTCDQPQGVIFTKHKGTLSQLENFLAAFAVANPL